MVASPFQPGVGRLLQYLMRMLLLSLLSLLLLLLPLWDEYSGRQGKSVGGGRLHDGLLPVFLSLSQACPVLPVDGGDVQTLNECPWRYLPAYLLRVLVLWREDKVPDLPTYPLASPEGCAAGRGACDASRTE